MDFEPGINTRTYKAYIDFAADYGLEYVVLDEGWSDPKAGDVMSVVEQIDLPELVRYADAKGVGLMLWVVGNVLDAKLEEACSYYAGLGIRGFKVDFIDRDDQKAVELVYRLAAWREIYIYLERCADACEHVADTVESVVMKNS